MPPSAYAIVGLFAVVSAASGVSSALVIGPRRPWAAVVPALSAFGVLYLVGHRLELSVGPEVGILGFRISLLFDVGVALATALAVGAAQVGALRLFQPEQRSTGRDGLA